MKNFLVVSLLVAALALPAGVAFAQGAAVSAVNGKVEVLGGNVDGDSSEALLGSISIPLGDAFGIQFDGAYGEIDDDTLKGVGVHLFTRDPENYLAGINVVHVELDDIELRKYALEAEYYAGAFTVAGLLGLQEGDVDSAGFATLDLRWYPLGDLMLEVGVGSADSEEKLHVGGEYQAVAGLSFFADLATGEDNYDHVLVGAKYYFGQDKQLIERHRQDDPENTVFMEGIETLIREKAAEKAGPSAEEECLARGEYYEWYEGECVLPQ